VSLPFSPCGAALAALLRQPVTSRPLPLVPPLVYAGFVAYRELSLTSGRREYALSVMTSWPLSRTLLLVLMLVLSALTPLAYASPPDPTWVSGFFDDGDNDDAVFLITSSAATLDPFPLYDSAPVPVREPAPVGQEATLAPCPCFSTAEARASPIA